MKKPELLAPCGSMSALEAAIEGGADAVYFGSDRFNARMRADNFSGDDLARSISLTKAYGIKSYITLNTRLFDIELSDALRLSASLYEAGADALIVADTGIARLIKKHIPELEIHASTQLSGHNAEDAKALMEAGFTRMVCHREITRDGLLSLCKDSPIEIEMFIHGAYCVSFSGQCLMSAVMGGRSGNRGECAQPCRQPYTTPGDKGKNYPISLKDMCLASHITDMIDFNVASLKIEGRQKPAEYVYKTVKIYRRLLDEGRNATAEEIDELERIFSRSGFSDGYFKSS
ncbi:MAG: U32 family peptidase, partial [Clostridia bacterium]|nr:U32 family peptidase [Clostridia bacterium]